MIPFLNWEKSGIKGVHFGVKGFPDGLTGEGHHHKGQNQIQYQAEIRFLN